MNDKFGTEMERFVYNVSMEVTETMDSFIFNTIEPYIKTITSMEISKIELAEAIALIRLRREAFEKFDYVMPNTIDKESAVAKMNELSRAYQKGYSDAMSRLKGEENNED